MAKAICTMANGKAGFTKHPKLTPSSCLGMIVTATSVDALAIGPGFGTQRNPADYLGTYEIVMCMIVQ